MAPSPGPGGSRRAPNRPAAPWPARSAWRGGCGRCRSRRRRSCRATSGSRRCGCSSTSRSNSPTPTPRPKRSWSSRSRPSASTRCRSCWPAGGPWSTPPAKKNAPHASYDQRSLHISPTFAGAWRTDGNLTAELGEIFRNAIDRRARELYRAEKAEADANGDKVESTAAQRRHDALHELLLQATAAGDEGNDVNVPAITAVIDVTKLPDAKPAEIVGETEHGTPVSAATALRWCCDAGISRVLTAPPSTPIDLGHTARLPNRAQRRALAASDRGCTFPGCDRPPGWTSAHHLIHWIHGGPTSLWNQTLLCTFHHHRVHEGRFNVERLPNGELRFTRPDGTTITVPKRRWNDAA